MTKNENVPALRFPGFHEKWEERKIGKSIDLLSGYPFDGKDISDDKSGFPLMRGVNITEGSIRHSDESDKFYCGDVTNLTKYFLSKGDLVIGMDGSKVGKNSAIVDDFNSNSLLIQRVARIRALNDASLFFIYHHINSTHFHKYVDEVKTSSGIPHISAQQIKDFKIFFPTLPEQQKIAAFLTALDTRIQQLTRKKVLLEQYKRGVMQGIFSQEIRFKDEKGKAFGEWEEKKLSDIAIIERGRFSPRPRNDPRYYGGDIPFVQTGDVTNSSGRISTFSQTLNEEGLKVSKLFPKGTILITIAANIGFCAILDINMACPDSLVGIRCKNNTHNYYLNFFLRNQQKQIDYIAPKGAQRNINIEFLKPLPIALPPFPEQQKIANFLTALDAKIKHVGEQITRTQTYKKGLLQQMFV